MTNREKLNAHIQKQQDDVNANFKQSLETKFNYSNQSNEVKEAIDEIMTWSFMGLHRFPTEKPSDEKFMLVFAATGQMLS